jgi:O-antigen ligase
MEKYKEQNITTAIEHELNAHNEYLQTFMALGIVGFLTLVLSLIIPGWYAFRRKQLLYLLFLMLFAFHMLVESMMAKQAGIVFYAFFNAVLFYWAFIKDKGSSKPAAKQA